MPSTPSRRRASGCVARGFRAALRRVARDLALAMVRDGEGATKTLTVNVSGARDVAQARAIARAIINSNLVKTALYGEDPNWGRIVAAAGRRARARPGHAGRCRSTASRGCDAARSRCSPKPRRTANWKHAVDHVGLRLGHRRSATPRRGAAISRATTCASTRATERDREPARHPHLLRELPPRAGHVRARRRVRADRRYRARDTWTSSRGSRSCALGHAHPAIAAAVAEQAARLVHCSNLYHHEPAGTLASELVRRSGLRRVFFCNSGTEANEAAIKLARKRAFRSGEPQRHDPRLPRLVPRPNARRARRNGQPEYHEGFGPLPEGFAFVPFNDVAALGSAHRRRPSLRLSSSRSRAKAACTPRARVSRAARRLCDERGALLIFDEIQCGMGRLGTMFAFESYGVGPTSSRSQKRWPTVCPSARCSGDERADGFQPGDHGTTFGGSPVPCAAALAHLRVRDAMDLDAHVRAGRRSCSPRSARSCRAVRRCSGRRAVRGCRRASRGGTLPRRRSRRPRSRTRAAVGTAGGSTIRFAPPLIVSANEIERAVAILETVTLSRSR